MVWRIVIAFVMLVLIMVGEHTGMSDRIQPHELLALICLIPYLIIGYDILYKAARNIRNGQVFDETQVKRIDNPGGFVVPESLYEQQLKLRTGIVPAWLNSLK